MHLDLNEIVSQVFQGRCQEKQMFQTPVISGIFSPKSLGFAC